MTKGEVLIAVPRQQARSLPWQPGSEMALRRQENATCGPYLHGADGPHGQFTNDFVIALNGRKILPKRLREIWAG